MLSLCFPVGRPWKFLFHHFPDILSVHGYFCIPGAARDQRKDHAAGHGGLQPPELPWKEGTGSPTAE